MVNIFANLNILRLWDCKLTILHHINFKIVGL